MEVQANKQNQRFFLGAPWKGNVWLDCEGWKGSLWEDSHPLTALVFSSVEQFLPKPERRGGKKGKKKKKRIGWMIEFFLYTVSWLVRVTVTK